MRIRIYKGVRILEKRSVKINDVCIVNEVGETFIGFDTKGEVLARIRSAPDFKFVYSSLTKVCVGNIYEGTISETDLDIFK